MTYLLAPLTALVVHLFVPGQYDQLRPKAAEAPKRALQNQMEVPVVPTEAEITRRTLPWFAETTLTFDIFEARTSNYTCFNSKCRNTRVLASNEV